MRERELEEMFREAVSRRGGLALKFVSPGCAGVPDRLVILPGGHIGFVELKAPGGGARKLQAYRIGQLKALGCMACVLNRPEQIDDVIDQIFSGEAEG